VYNRALVLLSSRHLRISASPSLSIPSNTTKARGTIEAKGLLVLIDGVLWRMALIT
jgi:hypothetical protein